jgi:hypothetical protein
MTSYSEQDILNMINTLQDEQTVRANTKYNLERFIGKQVKYLSSIQHDIKVSSDMWKNQDRSVHVYLPQWNLTNDSKYELSYDNLHDLIADKPNAVIKDIRAFGIFSIEIYLKD